MSSILALSGWKQSGKDTLANHLINNYGFTRVAFADILKNMVSYQYGIPRSWLDDIKYKETPILKYPAEAKDGFSEHLHSFMKKEFREYGGRLFHTPRSLSILEGSVKRSVDPNYWVSRVVEQINACDSNVVITDMRYRSELELLTDAFRGSLVPVRINRWAANPSSDPSEVDLDNIKFEFTVQNVGTLEEYYSKVDALAKDLGFNKCQK
jgi:hypothetical protein